MQTISPLADERRVLQPVFDHVDRHAEEFVERLRALCQMPSVSAENRALGETANAVEAMARTVGAETRQISLDGAPPLVVGRVESTGPRTLQLYNHYDVQPADQLELWNHPPFGAEIADGRIWARGVSDDKGNIVARLCAIEAYQRALGPPPLTLTFVYEGEEEVGSPHLAQFTNSAPGRELLGAVDACVWEGTSKDPSGRPTISLGCKGIAYVELRVATAARNLHSSWGAVVPNAAWRLVWALDTLKDPSTERVLIPGFYDRVRPPSENLLALADREPLDVEQYRDLFGISSFTLESDAIQARRRFLFDPTCTICGIWGGYRGPGGKTVLPAEAGAKVDFRLVPDQDPDEIVSLLRTHLEAQGFGDVEVVQIEGEGERAARTDPDAPVVSTVVDTARELYGQEPLILPNIAGTGPQYLLCAQHGVPAVGMGVGHASANVHAPDESIFVSDYLQGIKHFAWVMHRFAAT